MSGKKKMAKPGKAPVISPVTKAKEKARRIAAPSSPKANRPSTAETTKSKGKTMMGKVSDGDKSGASGAKKATMKRLLGKRI